MSDDPEETQTQYNEIEPEERSSLVSELGDRYDIQNIIGRGACGVVYKGFDRENAREVALKRMQYCDVDANGIPPHVLREVTALRSLMNVEANINIIRLYDVRTNTSEINGHIQESFTFVLEYIDKDLEVFLQKCPQTGLEEHDIKDLMRQLLSGVAAVHNAGLIHRDIKPQNILISTSGQLKISDFGLARLYRPGTTLTTEVVTQWYRAPEVILRANYTRAIDIWSVGCIFVQLYTLKPLFPGRSERQQLDLIFQVLSTPKEEDWPEKSCIQWKSFQHYNGLSWEQVVKKASREAYNLIDTLLKFKDSDRPMASEAVQHPYFAPSVGESGERRLVLESSLDSGIGQSEVLVRCDGESEGSDFSDGGGYSYVSGDDDCSYVSETSNEDGGDDASLSEVTGTPPSKRTKPNHSQL